MTKYMPPHARKRFEESSAKVEDDHRGGSDRGNLGGYSGGGHSEKQADQKCSRGNGRVFGGEDVRYSQDTEDVRYARGKQEAQHSVPCEDIRYAQQPCEDIRYAQQPCEDIRYSQQDNQDVRYSQDARYNPPNRGGGRQQQQQQQEPKAKARSRGGKNRSRGGGGNGGNGGDGGTDGGASSRRGARGSDVNTAPQVATTNTEADGAEVPGAEGETTEMMVVAEKAVAAEGTSSKKSGRSRGGRGGQNGSNVGGDAANTITAKIRKLCLQYDETQETSFLAEAYDIIEASENTDEGVCDAQALNLLLVGLVKNLQLPKAHKVVDYAIEHKASLPVASIVGLATSVAQRIQGHKGLRFLRRLIYEMSPMDTAKDEMTFFDRHVSFIYSELMAEADSCFGRLENRDSSILINLGFTELNMEMDWKNSSGKEFTLYNRGDDKGKKVYQPSVLKEGFARTDVLLMSYDIGHPVVAKKVPRDYDRLTYGAEVEVIGSATSPNTHAPLSVKVLSPPKKPFEEGMVYRLDQLASRDQTRRMLEALKVILWQPGLGSPLQPAKQLRELLLVPVKETLSEVGKTELPLELMEFGKERISGLESFERDLKDRYTSLNKSQISALHLACTQRISLIQGPPGTGKTTTAVQIVSALVNHGLTELPMLVTADSNTAVDNLVRGIAKDGLNVVRVGRPDSIRDDVKQYSIDGRWKELKKAEVICATCIGSSGSTLEKYRFATVLVDECTQAAESAALVPLARGCQQAILIGDQCQLPPTVLSDIAQTENLGESLFTRLVTQGVRPTMLDTQYRMNPLICEFASAAFYNGRLQNGVSHYNRQPPQGFAWPQRQMPVAFVNLPRSEEFREGSSYINPSEAEKVLTSLQEVCKNPEIKAEDVGIVTPYKGQVNLIKQMIRERPGLQNFRSGLEVESVDGFQGEEKAVIIFCAVRSNREGKVGFLSDWRRLNVMLTRAKRGCIIIGNRSTLVNDPLWKEWLQWATARGAVCGEGAKGTWVPRYLVDDRDGMWTVKKQIEDDSNIVRQMIDGNGAVSGQEASSSKEAEPEEPVDSWEDLGSSPSNSPLASPSAMKDSPSQMPGDLLEGIADEEDGITIAPFSPSAREAAAPAA